ncbi:MAG: diaminopimelate decarboxylase [Gammaproteobacteria bacterium]|jgi:diaminopimelate decarboxylase
MNYFEYKNDILFAEQLDLRSIAQQVGTPCYVYSRATLERHWHAFDDVLQNHEHLVCYAVKANSSLAILNLFARLGSGFDIVSQGELERVIRAGGDPAKVVFSGVGKTEAEMQRALEVGIHCFNVESLPELNRLNDVATAMGKTAPVSIRVNPDVDAKTHPYISTGLKQNKFGIDFSQALDVYRQAAQLSNIEIAGVDCHIGSQLSELSPFVDALKRMLVLIDQLAEAGITLRHIDVGGGLGITYNSETPPSPQEYADAVLSELKARDLKILIEPGRAIVGNAGILLTEVQYLKTGEDKNFAIVDAAMNDLIRPALYSAWQDIVPVEKRSSNGFKMYDIVGPICETGDFLGKDRNLNIQQGDLLAVCSAGAYGFTMSSNYNSRPRAAEVMVDGDQYHIIRQRETIDSLMQGETILGG